MKLSVVKLQDKVLEALADKTDAFYLAGGTALARYYFQHRDSEDLDFFTQEFDRLKIEEIIAYLGEKLQSKINLTAQQGKKSGNVQMLIYHLIKKNSDLKLDFVQDHYKLLRPCKKIDGIYVLSLSDIYIRKLYAIIGTWNVQDLIRREVASGRQEAKDYYDLYYLSHTFSRLSDFVLANLSSTEIEKLVHWYRTYDRMNIKTGLLDLQMPKKKKPDFRQIDVHFKEEIDRLLEKEIGKI